MDCDSFVLSIETQNIIMDLKKLEDLFDFSNLNENHELFTNKNKKVVGKFKIETPENIWIDEFVALRSKCFAFKCGNNSKKKLKVFLNLTRNIINLMNTESVYMEWNIKKNVIITFFVEVTMKCFFKK